MAGWSAVALAAILNATDNGRPRGARYAAAMNPLQRAQFEATCRAIHAAAQWHEASADGSAETPVAETESDSGHEIDTAAVATVLGVTERRVRQLASGWAELGLARKVGRQWLVDPEAIRLHQHTLRRTA